MTMTMMMMRCGKRRAEKQQTWYCCQLEDDVVKDE